MSIIRKTALALSAAMLCVSLSAQSLEDFWRPMISDVKPLSVQDDTVSLTFIGDVMMHSKQLEYNCHPFLEKISGRLKAADLAVANMEFTLAGEPYSGYPAFSAPDSYAYYADSCGIDVFLTANNHILDKGLAGICRTISVYDKMESDGMIHYTGISADRASEALRYPLIVPVRGIRIALVNFTYGTNMKASADWPKVARMEKAEILKAISRAKERGAELIIALPHWGIEYQLVHSKQQEEMATWLVENGADAVIGAHPHVVQDFTTMTAPDGKAVPVFYSLGNAVSNMSAENTRLELEVTLKVVRDDSGSPKILEPEAEFLWCTLPGKMIDNYSTIALGDYLSKDYLWADKSDWLNMIETYRRVKEVTGIKDNLENEENH